ncbi:MAG: Na/Pi cotransporter family protein [Thermincolia bacterium]
MALFLQSKNYENLAKDLDQIAHDLEEMTGLTFEGFLRHSKGCLDKAANLGKCIEGESKAITQRVLGEKAITGEIHGTSVLLVGMVNHFESIRQNLERIGQVSRTKISDGVLFSYKAVDELSYLFKALRDSLRQVHDIFLTDNPVLLNYLQEKIKICREEANRYATEHEERLIKGVCLPQSSSIYLLIMDPLKDILWHVSEIGQLLASDPPAGSKEQEVG